MLDLIEDFLALRSIAYSRLDGSTSRPRRTLDVKLVRACISPKEEQLTDNTFSSNKKYLVSCGWTAA